MMLLSIKGLSNAILKVCVLEKKSRFDWSFCEPSMVLKGDFLDVKSFCASIQTIIDRSEIRRWF